MTKRRATATVPAVPETETTPARHGDPPFDAESHEEEYLNPDDYHLDDEEELADIDDRVLDAVDAMQLDAVVTRSTLSPEEQSRAHVYRDYSSDVYVADLPLALIDESPLNNRKTFDPVALQELADDIRRKGVLMPVRVRPSHTNPGRYELAVGHRRARASRLADRTTLPAIVRSMSDREFLEILMTENLQREDVKPIEEAAGYRALLDQGGYDVAELARKVGKSPTYIYDRLRLLELSPAVQAAIAHDVVSLSHAAELGKVDHDAQDEVLRALFGVPAVHLVGVENTDEDPTAQADVAEALEESLRVARRPTVAALREYLVEEYYHDLATVPWDVNDATLVPTAGACTTCTKRTGAAPSLFPEIASNKDACLDRGCFAAKRTALVARTFLHESETAPDHADVVKISTQWSNTPKGVLKAGSYQVLSAEKPGAARGVYVDGPESGRATWVMLPKRSAAPTTAGEKRERGEEVDNRAERHAKQQAERAERQRIRDAVVGALLNKVTAAKVTTPVGLKTIVRTLAQHAGDGDALLQALLAKEVVAEIPYGQRMEKLDAQLKAASADTIAQVLVLCALGDEVVAPFNPAKEETPALAAVASMLRVDLAAITKAAKSPKQPKAPAKASTTAPAKAAPKKASKTATRP